jgi:hypothetical protein
LTGTRLGLSGSRLFLSGGLGMAKTRRGKKMTRTGKWILKPKKGRQREFSGTLLKTFNIGSHRLAIFSVPKLFD